MRQTAPPAPPLLEAPRAIIRGQAPDGESYTAAPPRTKDSQWWLPPPPAPAAAAPAASATAGWQPVPVPPSAVRLGRRTSMRRQRCRG